MRKIYITESGDLVKFQIKDIEWMTDSKGNMKLILSVTRDCNYIVKEWMAKADEIIKKGKLIACELKQFRSSRSLDANAAMWAMLGEMAQKLGTTKDELYIEMLDRYGVYTHIVVKPNVVDRVKQEWRTIRELGEVTINGKTGIQLQCYFGSHSYDSKEFSVLLDGIIEEGRAIGVDFISRADRQRMIDEWGK